jgi:hypothetical protein
MYKTFWAVSHSNAFVSAQPTDDKGGWAMRCGAFSGIGISNSSSSSKRVIAIDFSLIITVFNSLSFLFSHSDIKAAA